ncbi:hypothetical protein BpHYR1_041182 [Brachionus plicatilis]|uniref:Uncharacterized protein n=1 Tax=Brachionus plicatilis TaxID=10195 RepID=A0A3M7PXY6_BRAPC|nr:hypothetical protein BpHYR1_041182 [Brachionus plicatilis]
MIILFFNSGKISSLNAELNLKILTFNVCQDSKHKFDACGRDGVNCLLQRCVSVSEAAISNERIRSLVTFLTKELRKRIDAKFGWISIIILLQFGYRHYYRIFHNLKYTDEIKLDEFPIRLHKLFIKGVFWAFVQAQGNK